MNLLGVREVVPTGRESIVDATLTLESGLPSAELQEVAVGLNHGKKYEVTIKEVHKKRSLDANAYAWVLLQKLGEALHLPKEEVYRQIIRGWGEFDTVTMVSAAAQKFCKLWTVKGLGWIAEKQWDNGTDACILLYPGSSTYDTRQMSRFIDGIVEECKAQGIETLPPNQLSLLKGGWSNGDAMD